MWVGEGMLNKDVGRMENAREFLIMSNCNPRGAEKVFTSRIYFGILPLSFYNLDYTSP